MIAAVADTHAPIRFVHSHPKLSELAKSLILRAEAGGDQIAISTISLVEIVYLVEKRGVAPDMLDLVRGLIDPGRPFIEIRVGPRIVAAMETVPRHEVPDMPDRIIAATAVDLGVPLLSCDRMIRASSVSTIW